MRKTITKTLCALIINLMLSGVLWAGPGVSTGIIDLSAPGPIGLTTPGLARYQTDAIIDIASGTLTAAEVSNTILSNAAQTADTEQGLPAAAEGYDFVFVAATTVAKYYRFDPNGTEQIMFDGVLTSAGGDYIQVASVAAGHMIHFFTAPSGASTWIWYANTIVGPWVEE